MKITLNGEDRTLEEDTTIEAFMRELQLDPRKVAIEHNLAIVPCSEYSETYINDGDILEVVQFIGGG